MRYTCQQGVAERRSALLSCNQVGDATSSAAAGSRGRMPPGLRTAGNVCGVVSQHSQYLSCCDVLPVLMALHLVQRCGIGAIHRQAFMLVLCRIQAPFGLQPWAQFCRHVTTSMSQCMMPATLFWAFHNRPHTCHPPCRQFGPCTYIGDVQLLCLSPACLYCLLPMKCMRHDCAHPFACCAQTHGHCAF